MPPYVLIDGDNIQFDTFQEHVRCVVDSRFGSGYVPCVFCQTNVIVKYASMKHSNLEIVCSKTTNKNASDAQILLRTGAILEGDTNAIVVIVSNDKIFEEIQDNVRVFVIGYTSTKKRTKLKKATVLAAMKELTNARENVYDDIYLSDLYEYLNCNSVASLKDYIQRFVPELHVSGNDGVFFA